MKYPYYKSNMIVLGCCIFMAAVSYQLVIPFMPKFLGEMNVEPENISFWTGLIFSMQALSVVIATPIWGKLGDTYGRKPMILRAGFVISIMYLALYFCHTPSQLLLVRFINGFFTGFIPASVTLISTNTPKKKVLSYVATAQTLSAAGQIIGPSIGGFLGSTHGFRTISIYGAIAVFISTLAVVFFVIERNKPMAEKIEKTSILEDLKTSVKSPIIKRLMFVNFLQGFCINGIMPFIVIHLGYISADIPSWFIGTIYSVPAIAMIMTAQIWSKFGKKTSYYMTLTIGIIGAGINILIMANVGNIWSFALFFLLYGIFNSAVTTNTTAKTVIDIKDNFRGRALSVQSSCVMLGCVIAPLSSGFISKIYNTEISFVIIGVILLISGITFFVLSKKDIKKELAKNKT